VFQHMLDAAAAARTAEARGEGGPQPSAPSANTNATVYAVAERAAHLIQAA
jgi:choline dehydrogenase-like flavoprotein